MANYKYNKNFLRENISDPILSQNNGRSYKRSKLENLRTKKSDNDVDTVMLSNRKYISDSELQGMNVETFSNEVTGSTKNFSNSLGNYVLTSKKLNDVGLIIMKQMQHDVEINYLQRPTDNYMRTVVETVMAIHHNEHIGDILVFLPGKEEIYETLRLLNDFMHETSSVYKKRDLNLVPFVMHGGLSENKQAMAIRRLGRGNRKVVLSTNICEKSVTIEGISFVIDTCLVKTRINYFGFNLLCNGIVTKDSSMLRAATAGRVKPGKCFRLMTEEAFCYDFLMLEHAIPEIQRSDLTQVVLFLKAIGCQNLKSFEFFSTPAEKSLEYALEHLYALKAIDDSCNLINPLGKIMAELPFNPSYTRFIVNSAEDVFSCSEEACIIVATLSAKAIWLDKQNLSKAFDYLGFCVQEGDLITFFNAFQHFRIYNVIDTQWAARHYIDTSKMLLAEEILQQIKNAFNSFNIPMVNAGNCLEKLMKSICGAFFYNAAQRRADGSYELCR